MNSEHGKLFLDFFLSNLDSELRATKSVVAAVPNDKKSYKPDEKSKNAQELAWHLVTSEIWFLDGVVNGQFAMTDTEVPPPATIAEISSWYEQNYAERLAKLKAAPVESLIRPASFFGMMELPALMYLSFMTHHTAHHRGQLSAYLRAMGGKVPSIYGGSADEPFEMSAQAQA